jgi:hypothetical protein
VIPLLARATTMAAGFHLSVFDYEGANDESASEPRSLVVRISGALPDGVMRRRFRASEVVGRLQPGSK